MRWFCAVAPMETIPIAYIPGRKSTRRSTLRTADAVKPIAVPELIVTLRPIARLPGVRPAHITSNAMS